MLDLKNKSILVTGGTGSFGSEAVKKFLSLNAGEVKIFSRDEKKQYDMRNELSNASIKFILGDVRDVDCVDMAMSGVNYVFHAAALKQVPSCEFFPMEAVKTNILGAENVLASAEKNKVEKVVVLSTDKAVHPLNAMGMSKALMEKNMLARARFNPSSQTLLCATRYGNVLTSRGSVVPLFIQQIKEGLPLTITNPRMTRFLMSLEDSINLVLHALENSSMGDIFVQKAPAATIENLAKGLIKLFNSKSEIEIIGMRLGEKLHETLLSYDELSSATVQNQYFRVPLERDRLKFEKYFSEGVDENVTFKEYNSENTTQLGVDEVIHRLSSLKPIQEAMRD